MPRKLIDTFLFDGELALLAHRLAETADLVDTFVIVEAGETFQGAPKPLLFAENRDSFAAFADKIRHVALPRLGGEKATPWDRERVQRDAVLFALQGLAPDDVVLILDADEIPSRALLERLRAEGLDRPRRLLMTRHYEALDLLGPRSPCCPDPHAASALSLRRLRPGRWDMLDIDWFSRSGVAAPWHSIDGGGARRSLHSVRRETPAAGALPDAGRHLCFVDPAARPARKLGRVAHAELAGAAAQALRHLDRCRANGVHHRGWWFAERPLGPLPDDLERLARRVPEIEHGRRLPAMPRRRAARAWAWLRTLLPDAMVRAGDRIYGAMLPVWGLVELAARPIARLGRTKRSLPGPATHFRA